MINENQERNISLTLVNNRNERRVEYVLLTPSLSYVVFRREGEEQNTQFFSYVGLRREEAREEENIHSFSYLGLEREGEKRKYLLPSLTLVQDRKEESRILTSFSYLGLGQEEEEQNTYSFSYMGLDREEE